MMPQGCPDRSHFRLRQASLTEMIWGRTIFEWRFDGPLGFSEEA